MYELVPKVARDFFFVMGYLLFFLIKGALLVVPALALLTAIFLWPYFVWGWGTWWPGGYVSAGMVFTDLLIVVSLILALQKNGVIG